MKARLARLVACALPHLAVFAVMLLAFSPEVRAFWQCQGQMCGKTAWTCCCDSRDSDCSQKCGCPTAVGRAASSEHVPVVEDSSQGCHCTMVMQDAPKSLRSHATFLAPPIFFVSVVVPTVLFDTPREITLIQPSGSRGPPETVCLSSPSLRGPPLV